ncbi:hypothetical protein EC973_009331 [Apophysomyces ossiformis]|uniref:Mitochondrial fission process protein 1 n=1 Tax=Apophysomyces ossiformis TaxID=679940 RepID=A0A8H7BUS9_9FUNG|nr:hypothetical protein EC973_009331 [Apophysomyces ossiformis]
MSETRVHDNSEPDSLDTKARYLAYGARLKTALRASTRYIAYSSDYGEAFRPLVSPALVKAAYGISWAYVGLDVSYEAYKAIHAGKDNAIVATIATKRAIFQSLASMILPMMTIHSVVKYSSQMFRNVKRPTVRLWGPTALGLAVVPFLPYLFDHPVETFVDRIFEPIDKRVAPPLEHQTLGKIE